MHAGEIPSAWSPPLLDYLDVSAPNYFLGTSLFGPSGKYGTIFFDATYQLTTKKRTDPGADGRRIRQLDLSSWTISRRKLCRRFR